MQNEMTSLPGWAQRFLRAVCPESLYEEIEGDLIQNYNRDVRTRGVSRARRRLFISTVKFMRPGIFLRNSFSINFFRISMVRNYFIVSLRNLVRRKLFSFINTAGLAVGMAAFVLIAQYVSFESSFDQFHNNKNEIFRVALNQFENGIIKNTSARSFCGIKDLLKEHCPEVKEATSFMKIPANTGFLFGHNNKIYNEWGGVLHADTNFFKVFPSLLVRGEPAMVLKNPNSLVIAEDVARKIFGDKDPIGQHFNRLDDKGEEDYVITGVLKEIPENAHFHAKFIGKLEEIWPDMQPWGASFIFNYVTVHDPADPLAIEGKVNNMLNDVGKSHTQVAGTTVFLQPVTDIHLKSALKDEFESNGDQALVYILAGIGVMILGIAWMNYINIETARFFTRLKEVGVRRIVGSARSDLALQFLIEFFCLNVLASALACVIVMMILPHFSYLTGIPIDELKFSTPWIWVSALMLFIAGSLIAGMYPVLFLLRFNPVSTLKGGFVRSTHGSVVRRILMVVQFTVAIVLVAFLFAVDSQLDYMRVADKNVDIEKVITVRNPMAYSNEEVIEKYNAFKSWEQKLAERPIVEMVSTSSAIPGTEIGFTFVDLLKRNVSDPYDPTRFKTIFVGETFIPLYGIELLAGRNFRNEITGDWKEVWDRDDWMKVILNESAIHALGFKSPEEAVDQVVQFKLWDDFQPCEIIGVVKDYHHEAMKKEVFPMIFQLNYNSFQQVYYSIRLTPESDLQEAITFIEKSWKETFPGRPFEYFFLDDYYDQQFKSELHFSRTFRLFTGVALFIACLGILGTSLFEAHRRMKEISVRKILGASVQNLVTLLSKGYLQLILIAFVIAVPVIYIVISSWLETYPVRVELSPGFFIMPFAIILITVTLATIFQTMKTAIANPVDSLKHE